VSQRRTKRIGADQERDLVFVGSLSAALRIAGTATAPRSLLLLETFNASNRAAGKRSSHG